MRFGLDHVERRLQRLRAWCALGLFKKTPRQPTLEALTSDRPGLAVTIDVEIRETDTVRRTEQLSGLREVDQYVCLRRAPPALVTRFRRDRLIERSDTAAGLLELRAQGLERRAIFRLQASKPLKHLLSKRSTWIGGAPFDQTIQRVENFLRFIDGLGDPTGA